MKRTTEEEYREAVKIWRMQQNPNAKGIPQKEVITISISKKYNISLSSLLFMFETVREYELLRQYIIDWNYYSEIDKKARNKTTKFYESGIGFY